MGEREGPGGIHKIRIFWNWLARRDELPKLETDPEPSRRDTSVWSWLFAPETLPRKPSTRPRPRRGLSWLVTTGSLPNPPQRGAAESGSSLFWLLRPEKLPALPIDSASKEIS